MTDTNIETRQSSGQRRAAKHDRSASVGFSRDHSVVVRDRADRTKIVNRINVGPDTRISMKLIYAGRVKTLRQALALLKWKRRREQLRSERWGYQSDPTLTDVNCCEVLVRALLRLAETELSRVATSAWSIRETRIVLPAMIGSRPYFPAAP